MLNEADYPDEHVELLTDIDDHDQQKELFSEIDDCDSMQRKKLSINDRDVQPEIPLHNFTTYLAHDYCELFTELSRKAHLSKAQTNEFITFIKSGLPVPNNFPSNEKQLMALLNVEELFTKRSICLSCHRDIKYGSTNCSNCPDSKKCSIAHVYVYFLLTILYRCLFCFIL